MKKQALKMPFYLIRLTLSVSLIALPGWASAPGDSNGSGQRIGEHFSRAEVEFPLLAQVGGDEIGGDNGEFGGGDGQDIGSQAERYKRFSSTETEGIVALIELGQTLCSAAPVEYRVDCLAKWYRAAAKKIAPRGDYAEVRELLIGIADQLDNLVEANGDGSKPRIRVTTQSGGATVQTPRFAPVSPENVAKVNREAVRIISETETILLRSGERSAERKVHYQQIAAVIGSNKVLLRSS